MKIENCCREAEVLASVRSGNWQQDLRRHLSECGVCADVVLVAGVLVQAEVASEPPLPSAGFIWWKAQLRARREAVQRAAEPIALVERLAWGSALLALLGLGYWQRVRVENWWGWFTGLPYLASLRLPDLRLVFRDGAGFNPWSPTLVFLLSLCACLALVSLLLYLVLERE